MAAAPAASEMDAVWKAHDSAMIVHQASTGSVRGWMNLQSGIKIIYIGLQRIDRRTKRRCFLLLLHFGQCSNVWRECLKTRSSREIHFGRPNQRTRFPLSLSSAASMDATRFSPYKADRSSPTFIRQLPLHLAFRYFIIASRADV